MPIINFSKADILRTQNLENEKWYSWEISKLEGPAPSKDGKSLNFKMTLSLIDGDAELNGKEVVRMYNNKAMAMMIPIIAATKGMSVDQMEKTDFAFDTSELIGKKVDGKYTLETYEGQLQGRVELYLPYKSAASSGGSY